MDWDLQTYYPIFVFLAFVLAFVAAALTAAHTIGPKKNTAVKLMPYESGMDPIGDARQRFDIKFYLVAIMFLVFDVEVLFLYPWATAAYREDPWIPTEIRWAVFWSVLVFLALLAVAYVYDWKKGVFRWR